MQTPRRDSAPQGNTASRHMEALLDDAIAQTFPASDPVAITLDIAPEPRAAADIRIKRAYYPPANDGTRVLVDRLWPRGLDKARARIDLWLKDIAPSTKLRTWFAHDPAKWEEFKQRYREELLGKEAALAPLRDMMRTERVTLLFGAKDEQHNNALVLKEFLEEGGRH